MIRSCIRLLALTLLVLTVVVAALAAIAWNTLPLDRWGLDLGGATYSVDGLQGANVALVFVGVVAAIVVALVVAMFAVVTGLGFGAIGIVIGLLATAVLLALVVAPFAGVGWLVWRLLRSRPAPAVVALS